MEPTPVLFLDVVPNGLLDLDNQSKNSTVEHVGLVF
jgi:hypothetical protein